MPSLTRTRVPLVRALSFGAIVLLMACSEGGDDRVGLLLEGPGIQWGEKVVLVGDPLSALVDVLGQPSSTRDLGDLGMAFSYPDQHLSGLWRGPQGAETIRALFLEEGFHGQGEGGIQLGCPQASVVAELGEALVDPFLETWWYPQHGLGFEWGDDRVVRIDLTAPTP